MNCVENCIECNGLRTQIVFYFWSRNMKKIAIAISATIYLFTSIGAAVELHYCMGKFADGSLWHNRSSKCSICGMQKKDKSANKGCCRDEYKLAKIQQDQRITNNLAGVDRKWTENLPIILPVHISGLRSFSTLSTEADTPERSSPCSVLRLNCVLRI